MSSLDQESNRLRDSHSDAMARALITLSMGNFFYVNVHCYAFTGDSSRLLLAQPLISFDISRPQELNISLTRPKASAPIRRKGSDYGIIVKNASIHSTPEHQFMRRSQVLDP